MKQTLGKLFAKNITIENQSFELSKQKLGLLSNLHDKFYVSEEKLFSRNKIDGKILSDGWKDGGS